VAFENGLSVSLTTTTQQYGATYSSRITSQPGLSDYVMGICQQEPSSATSSSSGGVFYVVGTTQGIMAGDEPGGAFLLQLEVSTLNINWAQQISGPNVEGIACAVTPDGEYVYLGGNFPHGTALDDAFAPDRRRRRRLDEEGVGTSNSDIFVAQFETANANCTWIQSIGSPDDNERLAEGNGLAVDEQGNVFVYGNTQGSLFQENVQDANDIFVAFLSRDETVTAGATTTTPPSPTSSSSSANGATTNPSVRKVDVGVFLAVVFVVVVLLVGLFIIYRRRNIRKRPPPTLEMPLPRRSNNATPEEVDEPMFTTATTAPTEVNGGFHSVPLSPLAIPVDNSALSTTDYSTTTSENNGEASGDDHALVHQHTIV
jgi:hypothetical protein